MIIGCPIEIKNNENRVALTPGGCLELARRGHTVYIQTLAGVGSGYDDASYVESGGEILPTIEDVYAKSETIVKVKEPIASEYELIREGTACIYLFPLRQLTPADGSDDQK